MQERSAQVHALCEMIACEGFDHFDNQNVEIKATYLALLADFAYEVRQAAELL